MKSLDLFSGIGGFALGLEWAGIETVSFCESDRKCRKVLKKHWRNIPIFLDVETLTYEKLRSKNISPIDIIVGGFPCQDISLAGKGAGIDGARSGLWKHFARLVSEIRPRYAVVENVAALRSRGLGAVLGDLAAIGYDAEWHCIPACAVGAPHQRDRIWIIAYPNSKRFQEQRIRITKEKNTNIKCNSNISHSDGERCNRGPAIKTEFAPRNLSCGNSGVRRKKTMANPEKFERLSGRYKETYWNSIEPPVCGVAYGLSGRVDRLKQLGNSVVPQIPYLIGKAIMEYELDR
jgi:DNA (cytosine-5)-methyltransferase 1